MDRRSQNSLMDGRTYGKALHQLLYCTQRYNESRPGSGLSFLLRIFIVILWITHAPLLLAMGESTTTDTSILSPTTHVPVEVEKILNAFAKDIGKFRDLMNPKLTPALRAQFQQRILELTQKKYDQNLEYQIYPGGQITVDMKLDGGSRRGRNAARAEWMHLVQGKSGWIQAYFSIAGTQNPFDGCHYLVQKSHPQSATIECKRIFQKSRGVIWAAASTNLDWAY